MQKLANVDYKLAVSLNSVNSFWFKMRWAQECLCFKHSWLYHCAIQHLASWSQIDHFIFKSI